jgi:hypothetical protein
VITYGIVTKKGGLDMKDYTENHDGNFIKEYDIVNNKIISTLANGEKYPIPYSKSNKQKVLARMDAQLINLDAIEKRFKKDLVDNICEGLIKVPYLVFIGALMSPLLTAFQVFLLAFGATILLSNFIINIFEQIELRSKLNDVQKSMIYIKNKDSLNEHVLIRNKNILLGVNKKLCTKIDNKIVAGDEPVLDINFIGKSVTLKDLKKILENIERYKEFGFIEESTSENTEAKSNARVYRIK